MSVIDQTIPLGLSESEWEEQRAWFLVRIEHGRRVCNSLTGWAFAFDAEGEAHSYQSANSDWLRSGFRPTEGRITRVLAGLRTDPQSLGIWFPLTGVRIPL